MRSGNNQSVGSSAPVVSRCFPGGYNVKLYISSGRLAWWLLAFLCCGKNFLFIWTLQLSACTLIIYGYICLFHCLLWTSRTTPDLTNPNPNNVLVGASWQWRRTKRDAVVTLCLDHVLPGASLLLTVQQRQTPGSRTLRKNATIDQVTTMLATTHLDLSRCPLLHKSLQPPVLQTERVVIQPESSGWPLLKMSYFKVITTC